MNNSKKSPPTDHRREAVSKSFLIIKCVARAWSSQPSMPKAMWGLVNTCSAGAIYNTTHGGRNKEWTITSLEYIRELVNANSNCMVCTDHKTWRSYVFIFFYEIILICCIICIFLFFEVLWRLGKMDTIKYPGDVCLL